MDVHGLDFDAIVIGAGAAGLLAAARAAERGRRVLLVEKNRKAGVKILMSGGTRCNLTQATDRRGIADAFGRQGRFLRSPLAELGPDELVALIEAEGVLTKRESTGKIFPASDRAIDVRDALVRRLDRAGAMLKLGEAVRGVVSEGSGYRVATESGSVTCARVLITTGGLSYPGCGTTGDGYAWARGFGHSIVSPRPALVPLTSPVEWLPQLAGITLPDTELRVTTPDGAALGLVDGRTSINRGSLLFTHVGLSGPAVLNVSRAVTAQDSAERVGLCCDWLPELSEDLLRTELETRLRGAGSRRVASLLPESLPQRLGTALLARCGIGMETRAAELSKGARQALLAAMKRCVIPLSGTLGYAKAEVTAGGVALDEVDSRTMESKRAAGLFFAGEILDLDGPIGGYNFQAAFSTGWVAGGHL